MINGQPLDDEVSSAFRSLAMNNGDGFNALVETVRDELGNLETMMPALVIYLDETTGEGTMFVPPLPAFTYEGQSFVLQSVVLDPSPLATYQEVES